MRDRRAPRGGARNEHRELLEEADRGDPSTTCPGCGCEVDQDTCECGDPIDGARHDGHQPVPMGCLYHTR